MKDKGEYGCSLLPFVLPFPPSHLPTFLPSHFLTQLPTI